MTWRPEPFSDFHKRLKDDPEGASNAMDLSFQTLSKLTQANADKVDALAPAGGITRNRPTNPALYSVWFDTTLNKPIWYQGKGVWHDATGAAV